MLTYWRRAFDLQLKLTAVNPAGESAFSPVILLRTPAAPRRAPAAGAGKRGPAKVKVKAAPPGVAADAAEAALFAESSSDDGALSVGSEEEQKAGGLGGKLQRLAAALGRDAEAEEIDEDALLSPELRRALARHVKKQWAAHFREAAKPLREKYFVIARSNATAKAKLALLAAAPPPPPTPPLAVLRDKDKLAALFSSRFRAFVKDNFL